MKQHSLIISDLHLDQERSGIVNLFEQFLEQQCAQAESLYILGDLFEVWIGDDNQSEFNQHLITQLRQLSINGTKLFIMRGNRDFLLGAEFARQTQSRFLDDPSLLALYGKNYLFMHGDTLCSNDIEYQKMRKLLRSEQWTKDFLNKSLTERQDIALHLRQQSKQETSTKNEYIMDVDPDTVRTTVEAVNCDYLIHGHTHRMAEHRIALANKTVPRFVLGDWYESGSCIKISENGPEFISV